MNSVDISLDGLSAYIGIPTTRDFPPKTTMSLIATVAECARLRFPCKPEFQTGGALLCKARDEVIEGFLKSDCNRLFWIDSDMQWTPADFFRLLAMSTKVDVVGATYPAKIDSPTTVYYVNTDNVNGLELGEWGLVEIHGMGLGFTVVSREAIEKLVATKPTFKDQISGKTIPDVFRTDTTEEGYFRGEDMAFFADLRNLGYKVWLDPMIDLGHIGTKTWKSEFMPALHKVSPSPAE